MPFKPGESGNPKGKAPGTRHRATIAAERMLEGQAEAITAKLIELALEGDLIALRLCFERLVLVPRSRRVEVPLPPLRTLADAREALALIAAEAAAGRITPGEAADLNAVVETFRRTATAEDLERRVVNGGKLVPLGEGKGRLGIVPTP